MKVKSYTLDGSRERRILIGLITDDVVCGKISSLWNGHPFVTPWGNRIAEWCVEHYRKHNEAPRKGIETYFEIWSDETKDESTVKLVEDFLSSLSGEYEKGGESSTLLVDLAEKHFKRTALSRLKEGIESDIEAGQVEKAEQRVVAYSTIKVSGDAGIDLFLDEEEIKSTYAKGVRDKLINYPGALGEFMQHGLERDGFISFVGAPKSGKTWWLLDIAWRSMLERRRVGFFQIGDLSKDQIKDRFLVRAAKRPSISPTGKWPYTIKCPTSITHNREDKESFAKVENKTKTFDCALNGALAWEACKRVMQEDVRSKKSYFKLSTHANLTISIFGIKSIIDGWVLQGWTPDVVIIDYADLLVPLDKRKEARDQVNENWKHMRALATSLHCLLVTATQANAKGLTRYLLGPDNFSEDIRKLAHITGMAGINCVDSEKEEGVCRLNWLEFRSGKFNPKRCVHVAGCLDIANPAIRSTW